MLSSRRHRGGSGGEVVDEAEWDIGDQDGGERGEAGRAVGAQLEYNYVGKDPNAPLAYVPSMELQRPVMGKLGGHGGRLERERER